MVLAWLLVNSQESFSGISVSSGERLESVSKVVQVGIKPMNRHLLAVGKIKMECAGLYAFFQGLSGGKWQGLLQMIECALWPKDNAK